MDIAATGSLGKLMHSNSSYHSPSTKRNSTHPAAPSKAQSSTCFVGLTKHLTEVDIPHIVEAMIQALSTKSWEGHADSSSDLEISENQDDAMSTANDVSSKISNNQ